MTQRVAVVTGAQGGLGESMCKAMCDQNRTVVGSYLPGTEADALVWQAEMKDAGYEISIYPLDVTDYDNCCSFIAKVEEEVGPIDILVNNAGITRDGPLKRLKPEHWHAVLRTNLDSMYNMSQPNTTYEWLTPTGLFNVIPTVRCV